MWTLHPGHITRVVQQLGSVGAWLQPRTLVLTLNMHAWDCSGTSWAQFLIKFYLVKVYFEARHQWLKPVIPATWKAEIRRIAVQSRPRANSS
jgi:hypothetical protein